MLHTLHGKSAVAPHTKKLGSKDLDTVGSTEPHGSLPERGLWEGAILQAPYPNSHRAASAMAFEEVTRHDHECIATKRAATLAGTCG